VSLDEAQQLMAQAAELESEIIANNQQAMEAEFRISQLRGQLQMLDREIAATQAVLQGRDLDGDGENEIAGLDQVIEPMRQGQSQYQTRGDSLQEIAAPQLHRLGETAGRALETYRAIDQAVNDAKASYAAAATANDRAVSSMQRAQRQAASAGSENRESGYAAMFELLGSENNLVGMYAQGGQIALADAEARQQLLLARDQMETFQQRVTQVAQGLELATPQAVVESAQLVGDPEQIRQEAVELCNTAQEQYNKASQAVSRAPVDITETAWLYDMGAALAQARRYLLTGDPQVRQEALQATQQIISDNNENRLIGPVRRLERMLSQAG
jgi:hypothetical protein